MEHRVKSDLEIDLFNNISNSSLKFYNSMKLGHVVNGISIHTQNISLFIFAMLGLFTLFINFGVYFFLLLAISWKLTFLVIFLSMFFLPILNFFLKKTQKTSNVVAKEIANLHFRMVETLSAIPLVKNFCTEGYEKERFADISKKIASFRDIDAKYYNILGPLFEIILVTLLFFVFFIIFNFFKGDITQFIPFFMVYAVIFYRVFSQADFLMKTLSRVFHHIEPFRVYERLLKNSKESKIDWCGTKNFVGLKIGISFKNIQFSYDNQRIVLNNLNFFIPRGMLVAFVGETGSGKSTIAKLITGLYYAEKGGVFIDDVDIRELNITSLRKKIGFVTQETFIFNESIKYNIAYGKKEATDFEIERAAKLANIHDFIVSLPKSYDTILGEKGVNLSGGQRQLIAIARAILLDPEILVLDEATSSLDSKTENLVKIALDKASANCTVIAIAHRLSTILNAGKIIVLEKGEIVGQGTHEELIKNNDPYKRLYTRYANSE